MSRTTKPLPKLDPDFTALSDLPLESRVVLQHFITDELMYGTVANRWPNGCWLRRTDEHGNQWLSNLLQLEDEDYIIKEVNGCEVQ